MPGHRHQADTILSSKQVCCDFRDSKFTGDDFFWGQKTVFSFPAKDIQCFLIFCVTECDALRQEMGCTDAQGEVMNCANTNVRKRRYTVKNK